MDFRVEPAGFFARVLALASLFMGLGDATRLLGLGAGPTSPIVTLGVIGFLLLAGLSLMRLFAAVGLWIHARWGAVVLAGSLIVEIVLYLAGSAWVSLSLWGFIFKLAVMLATFALLAFAQMAARRQIAD
jgi:hypothetical protein